MRTREESLESIIACSEHAIGLLKDLHAKNTLTSVDKHSFVRVFSMLGEAMTFFRDDSPATNALRNLKVINESSSSSESTENRKGLVVGYTGLRNRLLHEYVFKKLTGDEAIFTKAYNFSKFNISQLEQALQNIKSLLAQSSINSVPAITNESLSLSASSSSSSSSVVEPKEIKIELPVTPARKVINTPPKDTSQYNILDYAIFAQKEFSALTKSLELMRVNLYNFSATKNALRENSHFQQATLNHIENICTCIKGYFGRFENIHYSDLNEDHPIVKLQSNLSPKAYDMLINAHGIRAGIAHDISLLFSPNKALNNISQLREINNKYFTPLIDHLKTTFQPCEELVDLESKQFDTSSSSTSSSESILSNTGDKRTVSPKQTPVQEDQGKKVKIEQPENDDTTSQPSVQSDQAQGVVSVPSPRGGIYGPVSTFTLGSSMAQSSAQITENPSTEAEQEQLENDKDKPPSPR